MRDLFGKLKSDLMEICKLIVELEDLIDLPIDIIPLDEAPPKLLQKFSLRIIAIVRGRKTSI